MIRYFRKELPQTPLYLPTGAPVKFDEVSDGYGYYATSNGYEIAQLLKIASEHRGGVEVISGDQYQEYLKKKSETPLFQPQKQRPFIGPQSLGNPFGPGRNAADVKQGSVGQMADGRMIESFAHPQNTEGLSVPKSFAKPRVMKIGSE